MAVPIELAVWDVHNTFNNHDQQVARDLLRSGRDTEGFMAYIREPARRADIGEDSLAIFYAAYNLYLGRTPDHPDYELAPRLKPLRETHSLARALGAAGMRQGIVTNGARGALDDCIEAGSVPDEGLFVPELVVETWQLGKRKPDPDVFELIGYGAMELYGIKAEHVLIIEDSAVNRAAVVDAGMQAGAFDPDFPAESVREIVARFSLPVDTEAVLDEAAGLYMAELPAGSDRITANR
jgi:FMN phosphatase YigB (HAD superfamily)